MSVTIYLAGAMRFTPDEEAYDRGWRNIVTDKLTRNNSAVILDPMKSQWKSDGVVKTFGKFHLESSAILHQDVAGIMRSDIVFMNLISLGTDSIGYTFYAPSGQGSFTRKDGEVAGGYPHIGTLAELGISYANQKLLIVIATNPEVTEHPFVRAAATRILPTLEDGIEYTQGLVKSLLGTEG